MTEPGSSRPLAATLARAVSHAEATEQRTREIAKAIERLVKGKLPFAIEQSHQQAVSDVVAYLSVLQTEVEQRRKQLNLIWNDLRIVGRILRLAEAPAFGAVAAEIPDNGNVVSLLRKRMRRHGADRLTADLAARVERLSGQIDQLNQIIEMEFKALSGIIDR
jgi:hypothetical protein